MGASSSTKTFKIPDGRITTNRRSYEREWGLLAAAVARAFGPTYHAAQADPGIMIRCRQFGTTVHLSTQAALDLAQQQRNLGA